jgi:hypothetical protein
MLASLVLMPETAGFYSFAVGTFAGRLCVIFGRNGLINELEDLTR